MFLKWRLVSWGRLWCILASLLLICGASGCAGGAQATGLPTPTPSPTPIPSPTPNPQASCDSAAQSHRVISYISSRALDGSNNDGTAINLWSINSDCTGNAPLTMLTVDPNRPPDQLLSIPAIFPDSRSGLRTAQESSTSQIARSMEAMR